LELNNTDARFEVGHGDCGLVGWNGRETEANPRGAGASLTGKTALADHLTFKLGKHPAICRSAFPPGVVVSTACA
jgi:hypothetical protein